MRTTMPKASEIERKWYVVDATGQTVGRLATEVASVLRGKNKPTFVPHMDMGDNVIIINAEKVKLTGNKENQKEYKHFTGYPGGLRSVSYKQMLAKHPERILEHAIRGMLPKNALGRQMYRKLFVYAGPDHKHEAQTPEVLEF